MSPICSGPLSERKEIEVLEESLREQAAEIAALRERLVEADYELSGEAAHEAPGLTYRTVRVGVEWYESWRARPEVVRALEEER